MCLQKKSLVESASVFLRSVQKCTKKSFVKNLTTSRTCTCPWPRWSPWGPSTCWSSGRQSSYGASCRPKRSGGADPRSLPRPTCGRRTYPSCRWRTREGCAKSYRRCELRAWNENKLDFSSKIRRCGSDFHILISKSLELMKLLELLSHMLRFRNAEFSGNCHDS